MEFTKVMGWCVGLVRPRTIVTLVVISGAMLAIVPLIHYIGPSLVPENERAGVREYSPDHHRTRRVHKLPRSNNEPFDVPADHPGHNGVHRRAAPARGVGVVGNHGDGDVPLSLSPDIDKRSEFQKAQVRKYCEDHGIGDTLPKDRAISNEAWKHLILDKERKILFCLAPKLASTNIRLLFAALNNVIDPSRAMEKYNHSHDLQAFRYRLSTQSKGEKKKILDSYFKFVMTRNPLERILSAYRNKFENHPISKSLSGVFDKDKIEMIKINRPDVYRKWERSGRTLEVFPTFNEFIHYLGSHSYYDLDPHFRPLQYICHPCVFHYDFYANLKLMPAEFDRLLKKFDIPKNFFKNQRGHRRDTGSLMPKYYAQLSEYEKKMVYQFAHSEMEFYYHIYPEERDMHIPLIGEYTQVIATLKID